MDEWYGFPSEGLMTTFKSLLHHFGSQRRLLRAYTLGDLLTFEERAVEYCTVAEDRLCAATFIADL